MIESVFAGHRLALTPESPVRAAVTLR